jgi:alkanesulfonate monooxygenase SsuD/methylene tetrahydromethanopterin reductase-like flavin-dependent oxidoreductase (luciferase family)
LLLPLHNPVELAEVGAFMDVISGGKFLLGVGLGYRPEEYAIYGIPMAERVSRLSEAVGIIRRLWTEDHVTHQGRHWQFSDATIGPRPLQSPAPPIIIGAQVKAAIARAANIADGWLVVPIPTLDQLHRVVQGQQQDVGPEPQSLGVGREALQQGKLRKEVEAGRHMVLAGPDRIEPERADQAHLLHRLGEAAGRVVARRVLRVQVDAKLHGSRPPTVMLRPCRRGSQGSSLHGRRARLRPQLPHWRARPRAVYRLSNRFAGRPQFRAK